MKFIQIVFFGTFLFSCALAPPKNPSNICAVFQENRSWYSDALDMNEKWGVPIFLPMAMMYQESSFIHNAKPPMQYFLGFIPVGRASSALGYAQALDMTWEHYLTENDVGFSSRKNFADSLDFMAWYITKSQKVNGISRWDAYKQYLNYHEGWGGYKRGTYKQKQWLIKTASKVQQRSHRYSAQLRKCQASLKEPFFRGLLR